MKSSNDFKKILLVICPLILAGCGGSKTSSLSPLTSFDDPTRPTTQTIGQTTGQPIKLTTLSFNGTWKTPCKRIDAFEHGLQMNTNYTESFTYTDNSKVAKLSYFYTNISDTSENVTCTRPKYEIIITSNIVFGDFINPGTTNAYREIETYAFGATLAINHNRVHLVNNPAFDDIHRTDIGITTLRNNWVQHIHQDITREFTYELRDGFKRFSYYAIGDRVPDIIRREGNKLYFGDQDGNKDTFSRPMSIGSDFFTKQ